MVVIVSLNCVRGHGKWEISGVFTEAVRVLNSDHRRIQPKKKYERPCVPALCEFMDHVRAYRWDSSS
jgi:hypothetical protein